MFLLFSVPGAGARSTPAPRCLSELQHAKRAGAHEYSTRVQHTAEAPESEQKAPNMQHKAPNKKVLTPGSLGKMSY